VRGVVLMLLVGCSGSPSAAPASASEGSTLVIPPLGKDAGTTPVVLTEPVEQTPLTPTTLAITARDPRLVHRKARSRALLLTEVKGLERLLATTAASAPDRPSLRRRIADSYSELAYSASGPDAVNARQEAINQLIALKGESPNYPQLDEVLYYAGLAYELNGETSKARGSYYDVILKAPASSLVPYAYFAFGELFLAEGAADSTKYALALQAYAEVLKHPSTPLAPDALLRIGETHLRMGDDAKAKQSFDRLRQDYPSSDAAARAASGR
jgi:TolA-binding protein